MKRHFVQEHNVNNNMKCYTRQRSWCRQGIEISKELLKNKQLSSFKPDVHFNKTMRSAKINHLPLQVLHPLYTVTQKVMAKFILYIKEAFKNLHSCCFNTSTCERYFHAHTRMPTTSQLSYEPVLMLKLHYTAERR